MMWFVAVQDGRRIAPLFGPLETREAAESYVDNGLALLRAMGGRAHFFTIGVAMYRHMSDKRATA